MAKKTKSTSTKSFAGSAKGGLVGSATGSLTSSGTGTFTTKTPTTAPTTTVQTQSVAPVVQQTATQQSQAAAQQAQAATGYTGVYQAPALTQVDPYTESAEVQALRQIYQDYIDGKNKPTYESKYAETIQNLANEIANRKDFSYDFNADPMYQQYKDQYQRQAQLGMQNATAQAAALTGGYGNSYAATAGNLAYQENMSNLNNVIPQLYQMAYNKYQDDISGKRSDLSMYQGLEDTDYGRYRDSYNDYINDRSYYSNEYQNARNFDYGKYRDTVADTQWKDQMAQTKYDNAFNATSNEYWNQYNKNYTAARDDVADQRYQDETNYNRGRDDIADQRYESEWAYQRQQDDLNRQDAERQYAMQMMQLEDDLKNSALSRKISKVQLQQLKSGKGSTSGGSGGGSYRRSGTSSSGSGISSRQRGVKNGNEGQAKVAWDSLHGGVIGQEYGLTEPQADYLYFEYLGYKDPPMVETTTSGGAVVKDKNESDYEYQKYSDIPDKYKKYVLSYKSFVQNIPSDSSLRGYSSYAQYLTETMERLKKGN